MDGAEQNPSGTVPGAQGSIIPLGWKPTADKPVPVVRCVVIKKDGNRCGKWSLRGHTKCMSHLGTAARNFPSIREHMDAVIESARMRLLDDSDVAIDTLEDLLQPGTSEGIRLKAATEVLDRIGVRGGFEVDVEVQHTEDPAQVLAQRLKVLRERGLAGTAHLTDKPAEVIEDAEVVDDGDHQQETLF